MLCEVDPQLGIHRFVKNIKGVTSQHLRKEFVSLRRRLPFSICGARLFSPLTTARTFDLGRGFDDSSARELVAPISHRFPCSTGHAGVDLGCI
jgi:hypothetical protein